MEEPAKHVKTVAAEDADKLVVLTRADWSGLVPEKVNEGFTYNITVQVKTAQCAIGGDAAALTYREPFTDELDNTELDLL